MERQQKARQAARQGRGATRAPEAASDDARQGASAARMRSGEVPAAPPAPDDAKPSNREPIPRGKHGLPDVQASSAMAGHYLAVVEARRRVQVALEHGPAAHAGRVADPEKPPDYDPVLWVWGGGPVMLSSGAELAAWYSPAELREMATILDSCIERHHTAMVKGYGPDALRIEALTRITKMEKAMLSGRSKRSINALIALMNGKKTTDYKSRIKGDESATRRLLEKKSKWTVLDVEPRAYRKANK